MYWKRVGRPYFFSYKYECSKLWDPPLSHAVLWLTCKLVLKHSWMNTDWKCSVISSLGRRPLTPLTSLPWNLFAALNAAPPLVASQTHHPQSCVHTRQLTQIGPPPLWHLNLDKGIWGSQHTQYVIMTHHHRNHKGILSRTCASWTRWTRFAISHLPFAGLPPDPSCLLYDVMGQMEKGSY